LLGAKGNPKIFRERKGNITYRDIKQFETCIARNKEIHFSSKVEDYLRYFKRANYSSTRGLKNNLLPLKRYSAVAVG
jgi:hypothetical protein